MFEAFETIPSMCVDNSGNYDYSYYLHDVSAQGPSLLLRDECSL